ncbi:glycosyltransferase family 4 protein [candidate division WOR-3 bacterium]|uniref:Glycosyltransferase family 4 protein n=1 Tax=candidate division WOR-3 bacterium TaxID=2052148 RepID=A0A938BPS3_UNCW3|nr:glycosyltransferase family 4 protein [candidate division WOR-3 bacterium]
MQIHVAVDAVGIKHSGGATVLLDLLAATLTDDRVSRITVFSSPRSTRNFDLPASGRLVEIEQPLPERSYVHRLLWLRRNLGRECARVGADVLFCATGIGTIPATTPYVTFVQQSLPFSREALQRCSAGLRLRMLVLRHLMEQSCANSWRVIVQTPTMLSWVAGAFRLKEERCLIVMPTARELPSIDAASPVLGEMMTTPVGQRILYVGNDSPYKNVDVAIRGLEYVRAAFPNAKLFITWPATDTVPRDNGVVCLGYLGKADLRKAYELATVLIQPSLVESGPLTMSEAMLVGTPVLVADRPYAHDMCEHAAVFFDPLNPRDFADKTVRLLQDSALRCELSRSGAALVAMRTTSRSYGGLLDVLVRAVQVSRLSRMARSNDSLPSP